MTDTPVAAQLSVVNGARTSLVGRARGFAVRNGPTVVLEALVNFVAPLLIFDYAKPHLGEVGALMASSGPPIVWSLIEFARKRRVDALSLLVLAGIGLSLLAFLGGGSVRLLQLREKLVTVLIGLAFLGSAAIGRPLIYQLARASLMRKSPSQLAEFEALRDNVHFRRAMTLMTMVWGVGLLAEAGVATLLVFTLSVHDYLLFGPIAGYGTMGGLGLWTWWYSRRKKREGEARRAAALAEG